MTDIIMPFGKYKGQALKALPEDYLRWILNPVLANKNQGNSVPKFVTIPMNIREAALAIVNEKDRLNAQADGAKKLLNGEGFQDKETPRYVVEDDTDNSENFSSAFESYDEAIAYLAKEYPKETISNDEADFRGLEQGSKQRSTPCPKRDQILIWEVLPSGHRKVVWHFSGYRYNQDKFGIPQGKLPGDEESLYDLAMKQDY